MIYSSVLLAVDLSMKSTAWENSIKLIINEKIRRKRKMNFETLIFLTFFLLKCLDN